MPYILSLCSVRMRLKERYYITSNALISTADTPRHTMYAARDRSSFITSISIDPTSFDDLLRVFVTKYKRGGDPKARGRPPKTPKHVALALVLHFYSSPCEQKLLSELFGLPQSTCSRILQKAEMALLEALRDIEDAKTQYPSLAIQREWAITTNAKEPLINGV
ncbi:hypothetical protein ACHHYP_06286 [Achlya hypogyna]|uniref:Transposase Helix-turn-helix domain-containing protein n=1 Tax=Achlya hypogyna TaxID=1202772 RepID=A0A1V9YUT1_ACHHY|nr:hypothetical protein ACHHYP_06286 [Achlya hypogyna]